MNMFQIVVIFKLQLNIGLLNLGFGTYYDHCALEYLDLHILSKPYVATRN